MQELTDSIKKPNLRIMGLEEGEEKTSNQSSIDSAAHNQILKQRRHLNGRNHHIPININTEYQWNKLPHQNTPFSKLK
jgi:hypothetical protein